MSVAVTAAGVVCLVVFLGLLWWPSLAVVGGVGVTAGLLVDWEALTRGEPADTPQRR